MPLQMENTDTIIIIETNYDDTDGERLGLLMEQLLHQGALDVSYTPIQMKKNRPGVILTVMALTERLEQISDLLFQQSGTLGIRVRPITRIKCQRETININTKLGCVRLKIARWKDQIVNLKPEYEDCKEIALKYNIALQEVRDIVLQAYLAKS